MGSLCSSKSSTSPSPVNIGLISPCYKDLVFKHFMVQPFRKLIGVKRMPTSILALPPAFSCKGVISIVALGLHFSQDNIAHAEMAPVEKER